jgi:hypothetical protein
MLQYRRRYITFIEIMIIITILIITLGLIGVNIRDLIKQQKFKSEVSLVVDQLRLAQDLMLILNTDSIFKIAKDDKGLTTSITVETNLPPGWQREILRQRPPLTSIVAAEFDDRSSGTKTNAFPLELHFLSEGSVMSQGVLRLASRGGEMESFICLPGYPSPLESISDLQNASACNKQSESDFFEKLTFYTRREIEERVQKNALQGNP